MLRIPPALSNEETRLSPPELEKKKLSLARLPKHRKKKKVTPKPTTRGKGEVHPQATPQLAAGATQLAGRGPESWMTSLCADHTS